MPDVVTKLKKLVVFDALESVKAASDSSVLSLEKYLQLRKYLQKIQGLSTSAVMKMAG